MVQEIIVYIILIATALHLAYQTFLFFKLANGDRGNGSGCAGGSCSNCSMKIDFDSIQLSQEKHKPLKNRFVEIKK